MAYEIQSKMREMKALGGMPSSWKIEFVEMHEDHVHFINVDFTGEHHDRHSVELLASKILKALNEGEETSE